MSTRTFQPALDIRALLPFPWLIIPYSGGEEVMLDVGGQDATEAFEDVGHSDEARETLEKLLVGTLKRQVIESPLSSI